jgi:putative addiction module component (TIGR02574 family)
MSPPLSELLKLQASERAELAMAVWESLSVGEREATPGIEPEQAAELDRRWTDTSRARTLRSLGMMCGEGFERSR